MKGILYYTDNRLPEPIISVVQKQILKAGLPIISVSLKPINFGINIVIDSVPSVMTMFNQILAGLVSSGSDMIFLAEHDVLYHPSHFDFNPLRRDTYYYNTNVWRWDYPKDRFITYDRLISLSGLCADRDLLICHYEKRLERIAENGWEDGRDPGWARKMGYEPGKRRRRGGFMDEKIEEWKSSYPNIDIRHKKTLTPQKVSLDSFRHQPVNWQETAFEYIQGWETLELWN